MDTWEADNITPPLEELNEELRLLKKEIESKIDKDNRTIYLEDELGILGVYSPIYKKTLLHPLRGKNLISMKKWNCSLTEGG